MGTHRTLARPQEVVEVVYLKLDSGYKKDLHSSDSEGLFVKLWKEGVYRAMSPLLWVAYGERQAYSCCRTEQDDLERR